MRKEHCSRSNQVPIFIYGISYDSPLHCLWAISSLPFLPLLGSSSPVADIIKTGLQLHCSEILMKHEWAELPSDRQSSAFKPPSLVKCHLKRLLAKCCCFESNRLMVTSCLQELPNGLVGKGNYQYWFSIAWDSVPKLKLSSRSLQRAGKGPPIIPSSVPPVMSAQAKITRLLRSTAPIKDNKLNGIYHLELMEQKFKLSINILKGI